MMYNDIYIYTRFATRVVRQMQEFSELTQQYQNEEAAFASEQQAFSTEAAAFTEELKQFHTTSSTSTKPF